MDRLHATNTVHKTWGLVPLSVVQVRMDAGASMLLQGELFSKGDWEIEVLETISIKFPRNSSKKNSCLFL